MKKLKVTLISLAFCLLSTSVVAGPTKQDPPAEPDPQPTTYEIIIELLGLGK
ncbi:MAG: hypothetical protein GW763_05495 [Paraglaciecola sp.]|nr:hypothetical protein [Paraglaciecola sp.]NCT47437.1 hypothetical protein [Paraglaciecola sp.]